MGQLRNRIEVRTRRKLKGLLLRLRSHRFIPGAAYGFLAQTAELSKWVAEHEDCAYSDFYTSDIDLSRREQLYEHVISTEGLDAAIDYLEFGVSRGQSFRWWLKRIRNEDARFYGFDTFTGLPENWGVYHKGDMGNDGKPPQIDDPRHEFHQGIFQDTLVPFLRSYEPHRRKVIHMDADLYTATLYVLTLITPYLKKGDVIFFDEFNVPMHEFKAFTEWTRAFEVRYTVLGAVNNFFQVAMRIE